MAGVPIAMKLSRMRTKPCRATARSPHLSVAGPKLWFYLLLQAKRAQLQEPAAMGGHSQRARHLDFAAKAASAPKLRASRRGKGPAIGRAVAVVCADAVIRWVLIWLPSSCIRAMALQPTLLWVRGAFLKF